MTGKVPAYGVRGRQQVVQEDDALSSAESGSGYEIRGGEASLTASVRRSKTPMKRRAIRKVGWKRAVSRGPSAPSSGELRSFDMYQRSGIGVLDVALSRAGSGSGYEIRGGEASLTASVRRSKAPMKRRVFQKKPRDPNALPSGEVRPFDAYQCFYRPESRWLADALAALEEVDDEIAEENLPQVSDATKAEAERIIRALEGRSPTPTVYPTQDAEIALHFKSPDRPNAVVILLSDSVRADCVRADCHAYIGGRSRRAHYDISSDLPDTFVREQLRLLTPPIRAAVWTTARSSLFLGIRSVFLK